MRKTAYLVLFNLISALGWAYLAYVTFSSLATGPLSFFAALFFIFPSLIIVAALNFLAPCL